MKKIKFNVNNAENLKLEILKIWENNNSFKKAIYLDVPCYHNLGDMLIYLGAKKFLTDNGVNILYQASALSYDFDKIEKIIKYNPDAVILLQGGGNFGDLYPEAQDYRLEVIKRFKENKIIILPQTIWYEDERNIESHALILNQANDLKIYTRDSRSFELAKRIGLKAELCPDTAHWLWSSSKINLFSDIKINNKYKSILIHRTDGELQDSIINKDEYQLVTDWPVIESKFDKLAEKLVRYQQKRLPFLNGIFMRLWYFHMISFCRKGVRLIISSEEITTSRLHGFILANILEKNAEVIDNSYGKNYAYIKQWLV
ncbi:polysaccharide pyruvyl transferase family protein [Vibrio cholerae]|nr:hypothetical protein [Vibrio cholerae]